MEILDVPGSLFVSRVYNHQLVKDYILGIISSNNVCGLKDNGQSIYNTDYALGSDYKPKYYDMVASAVSDHMTQVSKAMSSARYTKIYGMWYQQYGKGDFHKWHSHPGCIFSNVYYVQLEGKAPRTSFKHMGIEFELTVEEGMVVTFPSYLLHCSKPNHTNSIKTVVSFNADFVDIDPNKQSTP